MTEYCTMSPLFLDAEETLTPQECELAASILRGGRLAVLPTDTVYGIGVIAADPIAVSQVLAAKGRGRQMPPPVLVPSVEAIDELAINVPQAAYRLAKDYWPGALTLILQARPDLGWDLGDTNGTIAVRMPDHPATLQLLRATGPLAVTSANTTGNPPALTCQEAYDYFGERVDLYIDGGSVRGGIASTILHFGMEIPQVIRLGALSIDELREASGIDFLLPEGE